MTSDTPEAPDTVSYPLSRDQIDQYRRDGFIRLRGVFGGAELEALRAAVEGAVDAEADAGALGETRGKESREPSVYDRVFTQRVDLWRRHPAVAAFTLSGRLADIAARLEGAQMRLWHDQALFKEPDDGAPNRTPWHQDANYWPHHPRGGETTAWIALRPTDPRNGCLAFLAGSHRIGLVPAIDFNNPIDVFEAYPQLQRDTAVSCPLEAGDCTFHNGLTFHFAGSNRSPQRREGYAVLYMRDGTEFTGDWHPVTAVRKPTPGQAFNDDFPRVGGGERD